MGAWGTDIDASDTYADVYSQFFDTYNNGASAAESRDEVIEALADYFEDYDDKYDAHFALAYALWEVKALDDELRATVTDFIESGAALKNWKERDASAEDLEARATTLTKFLERLKEPRKRRKARRPRKFDFRQETLVALRAPDGRKELKIEESYGDGEYLHTLATVMWEMGGGTIFACRQQGLVFEAHWRDSQNLEIKIPKAVEAEIRSIDLYDLERTQFFRDVVNLHCIFV